MIQFFTNQINGQGIIPIHHKAIFEPVKDYIIFLGQIIQNVHNEILIWYITFLAKFIYSNSKPFQVRNPLIGVLINQLQLAVVKLILQL